jgi:hypothetical protein
MPVLLGAHRIYNEAGLPRWELEGRLLGGEATEQVAVRCGCGLNVIECYAALFFDVLQSLRCRDYVANIVIGPRRFAPTLQDIDVLIKMFSYAQGPLVVDVLVQCLTQWPAALNRLDLTDPAGVRQMVSLLRCRLAVLAEVAPAELGTLAKLELLCDLLEELDKGARDDGLTLGPVHTGLGALGDSLCQPGTEGLTARARVSVADSPRVAFDPEICQATAAWPAGRPRVHTTDAPPAGRLAERLTLLRAALEDAERSFVGRRAA